MKLFRKILLVSVMVIASSGMGSDADRFKDLGEQFMCICSCNQLLTGCTMNDCPDSGAMRAELAGKIAAGQTDQQIRASFVEKYGAVVLSAPTTSGINIMAWIMPFAVLFSGMIAVVFIVRTWRGRTTETVNSGSVASKDQSRIEDELKKYTPED